MEKNCSWCVFEKKPDKEHPENWCGVFPPKPKPPNNGASCSMFGPKTCDKCVNGHCPPGYKQQDYCSRLEEFNLALRYEQLGVWGTRNLTQSSLAY